MSAYDPQRRRRLTTRANTTAVEALLDGEPSRPRRPAPNERNPGLVAPDLRHKSAISDVEHTADPLATRGGCLSALLTLGRR